MTKRLFTGCCLALLLASTTFAAERHIVTFKGSGAPADFEAQVAAAGGRIDFQHKLLALVSGLSTESAAQMQGVAEIQADAEFLLDRNTALDAVEFNGTTESPAQPALAQFYAYNWNVRAIGADQAWAAGRVGSPDVTVAVLDTGIDRQRSPHVDLNGRVDYARGRQFSADESGCIPTGFQFDATDDLNFHGTHVASTISSNAWGMAGVTSKVRLVPVKVLSLVRDLRYDAPAPAPCSGGSGSLGAVLAGVLYAADIDADVANMSLGGGFSKAGNGRYIGLINTVFNYAHRAGTLVVVSSGNESIDLDHDGNFFKTYCSSPNVVCVSATGPTNFSYVGPWTNVDAFAAYSNYGRSAINVAAPGGNGSYVWAACSRSAVSAGLAGCRTTHTFIGSVGTSMASPHVSGLAALLVEQVGKNRPSQIKSIIEQSADDLGQPGTDPFYGKGRINVPRALGLQ